MLIVCTSAPASRSYFYFLFTSEARSVTEMTKFWRTAIADTEKHRQFSYEKSFLVQ